MIKKFEESIVSIGFVLQVPSPGRYSENFLLHINAYSDMISTHYNSIHMYSVVNNMVAEKLEKHSYTFASINCSKLRFHISSMLKSTIVHNYNITITHLI